jgi:predicted lipoprotein
MTKGRSKVARIAVAVRTRGLDGGVRQIPIASALSGALLDPETLSAEPGLASNIPTAAGFVALDGLSSTAYVLSTSIEPLLPEGWHVFRMPADRSGVEAMRRVARSLNPMSPEEEGVWDDWLNVNPTNGKYLDNGTSNSRLT